MPPVLVTSASCGSAQSFATQYLTEGWHVYGACPRPHRPTGYKGSLSATQARSARRRPDVYSCLDVTDAETIVLAAASVNDRAPDLGSSAGSIPSLERASCWETKRALGRTD